jgi:hypothetical protein
MTESEQPQVGFYHEKSQRVVYVVDSKTSQAKTFEEFSKQMAPRGVAVEEVRQKQQQRRDTGIEYF